MIPTQRRTAQLNCKTNSIEVRYFYYVNEIQREGWRGGPVTSVASGAPHCTVLDLRASTCQVQGIYMKKRDFELKF